MRFSAAFILILSLFMVPQLALAESSEHHWTSQNVPVTPLFSWQHHGSFRFRFQNLHNLALKNRGTSGFYAPIDSSGQNSSLGQTRKSVEFADIRFRYEPSILVGEFLAIHAQADFLDNLILGSNPVSFRQTPISTFFADSLAPPRAGINGFRDSVRIKAAWADLKLFGRLHVYGGRITEHFGLGLIRNRGSDLDADFADYADGVYLKIPLVATWFRIGLEFPNDGITTDSPVRVTGTGIDASQTDDVVRWVFSFDSTPMELDDQQARTHRLHIDRKPAVDWGMYHSITWQDVSSERIGGRMPASCGTDTDSNLGLPYDCYTLTPREAFFWTPSLWGRLEMHPRPRISWTLEAEVAMVFGHINHTQSFLEATKSNTRKDFLTFGGALESKLDIGANRISLFAGAASGDGTSRRFGVLDGPTIAAVDDTRYALDPAVANNSKVYNFLFNRGYRVDSILFREVIGTVTNAFYFKPTYERQFLQGEHGLSAQASLLAAFAIVPAGTPGGSRLLGIEPEVRIRYEYKKILLLQASGAVLFPLSGLRTPQATSNPDPAVALRILTGISF